MNQEDKADLHRRALSYLADKADQLLAAYLVADPGKMPSTVLGLDLIAWGKASRPRASCFA